MTLHAAESIAIVAAMLVLFMLDRIRYDIVAGLALCAAALLGVIPRDKVFDGFANPVIVIIASVLVIGRAVAVSGLIEAGLRPLLVRLSSISLQVGALTACVTFLSAFLKNVGTLGIFLPIAVQTAERASRPPSLYLMPLAFGSLVGGTITQIGTSPNLLITAVSREVGARPFTLFDFAPVGLPLSVLAVLFLAVGWRLIPKGRRGQAAAETKFRIEDYTSEVKLTDGSSYCGKTVGDLEELGEGEVVVAAVVRPSGRRRVPDRNWPLSAGDILVLQGDPVALQPVLDGAGLELLAAQDLPDDGGKDNQLETAEAVVSDQSLLLGRTLADLAIRRRYELNILAIARSGEHLRERLQRTPFQPGDKVVVQGRHDAIADNLSQLGLLPLAERNLTLGGQRRRLVPVAILLVCLGAIAFRLVSAELAFFGAAVLVVLFGSLSPRQAYEAVDWPIIVMLGSLIPVGEALKETGAAAILADGLTIVAAHLSATLAVGFVLLVSMLVTPFLHHAAAVLVMGPVAAAVAHNLGFAPEAFLMAVALGCSCDFLTPIGHQNNLLVMAPGGYRFSDYWRLGLPLTILVLTCGTLLIRWWWPI